MNGVVGFNPDVAVNFNKELNNLYNQGRSLHKYYMENIYELITYSWYAPEAVEMDFEITRGFNSIDARASFLDINLRLYCRDALSNWCRTTQTDMQNYPLVYPDGYCSNPYRIYKGDSGIVYEEQRNLTDRKILSKRSDGFVGVISENIPIINDHIRLYNRLMIELLDNYEELINRHQDMLLGEHQMEHLMNLLKDDRRQFEIYLPYLTSSIIHKMSETKEKYEQVARSNASMFASGN